MRAHQLSLHRRRTAALGKYSCVQPTSFCSPLICRDLQLHILCCTSLSYQPLPWGMCSVLLAAAALLTALVKSAQLCNSSSQGLDRGHALDTPTIINMT